MAMTRKEFLASAASVGALSACAGTRFWLPRKDSLRVVNDWTGKLLRASWPNNNQFVEIQSDTENYNDIYATYPIAS